MKYRASLKLMSVLNADQSNKKRLGGYSHQGALHLICSDHLFRLYPFSSSSENNSHNVGKVDVFLTSPVSL